MNGEYNRLNDQLENGWLRHLSFSSHPLYIPPSNRTYVQDSLGKKYTMKAAILQISEGYDIIGSIVEYATKNQVGVLIISASGSVRDVTLTQPNLSFPGTFHMLSLNGTFNVTGSAVSDFVVTLSGEEGQLVKGIVAGQLVAASDVQLAVVTTSDKPEVYTVVPGGSVVEEEEEEDEDEDEEEEDEDEDEDEDEEEEDEDEEEGLTDNE